MATTTRTSSSTSTIAAPRTAAIAWLAGVLLWGVADVAITAYGLNGLAIERHFAYETLLGLVWQYGPWEYGAIISVATLVLWKLLVLPIPYAVYRVAPREWRVGVPVGLVVIGAYALVNNLLAVGAI